MSPDGLHEVWVTDESGRFSVQLFYSLVWKM
jgi:hypothetical protein